MRSAVSQAKNAYNTASSTAANAGANADQIGSSFIPGLEREAQNPTGFTPQEMNDQLVAGEQGAGGANSGIAGEANSRVARTRNSAGYSSVLDQAARDKTQTLSQNALGVKNQSAELAQQKQMSAEKQLQGLYGTDVNENLEAQGLSTKDISAEAEAGQSGWFQNMTNLIAALGKGAQGAASAKQSFG